MEQSQHMVRAWRRGFVFFIVIGFVGASPWLTGTIFPFLVVCCQALTVVTLIGLTIQFRRRRARSRASQASVPAYVPYGARPSLYAAYPQIIPVESVQTSFGLWDAAGQQLESDGPQPQAMYPEMPPQW